MYNFLISDIYIEKIMRNDNDFWKDKMETQLVEFYNNHLLEEIVYPKIFKWLTMPL